MADITSANEYIAAPATPNPYGALPGGGPMTAANGNIGALQGALYRASQPMMDQDSIDEVKDTLFSRVRSPEDLAASKENRRGALSALQQANLAPDSDWTPDRYIAYGMAKNDKPWDVTNGVRGGIAAAMEADLLKQGKKYKAGVDNGKLGLDFENNEEKIDDKVEGKSLEDLTSMANAQSRINAINAKGGAGGMGTRWKTVAGVGLVDTWAIDPETGKSKPEVVVKGPQIAQMTQKAFERASKEAESEKNPMDFLGEDGKPSLAKKNAWIRERTNEITQQSLMGLVDPQMKPDFQGIFSSPPPGGAPAGAPAGQPPVKYNGQPVGPTNAGERRMASGIAALGNPKDGDPPSLPGIPAVSDMVKENVAIMEQQKAILADPAASTQDKMKAQQRLDAATAANLAAMKADIGNVGHRPAPAATAAPAPAAPSAAMPGVAMKSQADNIRENKTADAQATTVTKYNDEFYHRPAAAAESTLSTVNQLRSVPFNSGAFANQKKTIGNVLEAIGIKGSLVTEAGNITNASKILAQEVNAKVKAEVGVQTDSDVARQAEEGAKITDPAKSWQFSLNQMEESAKRKIERSSFVKQMELQGDVTKKDIRKEWLAYSEQTLGPSVASYQNRPVFRNEFIKQAVAQNADMDPKEAEKAAAQAWLQISQPKGKK